MSHFHPYTFLLLFIPLFSCAQEDRWSELDTVLEQLAEEEIFHGSVLIAENHKIIFQNTYGQHPESKTPIRPEDPMDIASLSKPLTAAGVMVLASKGKLDLDDPLSQHIPELTCPDISIRHLLQQTSGLERFLPLLLRHWNTRKYIDNENIVDIIEQHPPACGKPGADFQYNDANYTLLASVIERVSGKDYTRFMEKKLFQPYKMKNTVHRSLLEEKKEPTTADHFMDFEQGSSNMMSTAADLYLFVNSLNKGKKIKSTLLKEAFSPAILNNGELSNYGYGWFIQPDPELLLSHRGEGFKVSSGIKFYPQSGKCLIVIHPYSNIYFNKVFELIEHISSGKDYSLPVKRTVVELDTELLKNYVGKYESQFGLLHITLENGQLYLRPDPIPAKEPLIPSSETTFYFGNQDMEWEFFRDDEGQVIGLGIKGERANMGLRQR